MRQRAQVGCSLLHLTFDAAHISHDALNFGFRCLCEAVDLGAEVGGDMVEAVVTISVIVAEGCHCEGCGVECMSDM